MNRIVASDHCFSLSTYQPIQSLDRIHFPSAEAQHFKGHLGDAEPLLAQAAIHNPAAGGSSELLVNHLSRKFAR